jgi:hypothetical protein
LLCDKNNLSSLLGIKLHGPSVCIT